MCKNFRKFMLLWSGELVSSIGGGLTSFGLTVFVFSRTGSAASTAMIALLAFLPNLLLGVPAGVLADRIDRRLLMMLGDGLSAIGLIYILICMLNGGAQMWQICLGVTVSSVFSSLMEPSYKATVSDLLTEEEYGISTVHGYNAPCFESVVYLLFGFSFDALGQKGQNGQNAIALLFNSAVSVFFRISQQIQESKCRNSQQIFTTLRIMKTKIICILGNNNCC